MFPVHCHRSGSASNTTNLDIATEMIAGSEKDQLAGIKCCLIKKGELSPGFYSVADGLLDIEIDVSGKKCTQPQGNLIGLCSNMKYMLGKYGGSTLLKSKDVKTLDDSQCENDKTIGACDDFDMWKKVLINEGINTVREQNSLPSIAEEVAKLDWGTAIYGYGDNLWNRRKDTVKALGNLHTMTKRHGGGHKPGAKRGGGLIRAHPGRRGR